MRYPVITRWNALAGLLSALSLCVSAISSLAQSIDVPGNLSVRGPLVVPGGSLKGEYWKRTPNTILTDGATVAADTIDVQINSFGPADGTFAATLFNYTGNDLSLVKNWLAGDGASFAGTTNNLDDGAFRFSGFVNVPVAGILNIGTTSDDGVEIKIGGLYIVNNDGSHGNVTKDQDVNFLAAGLYPIEITYFNGDWTSDGNNHTGNPDPSVHGGANFHLRVGGADVTPAQATIFYPSATVFTVQNLGANRVGTVTNNGGGSFSILGGGNDIWDNIDE
ncbi:MAG TPA: PA14 domain-containing protein, partial [Candidatus Binatia bacterium]|nr:PA14 domain-containing protein [Candidatus Binatia bacterium]